MTVKNAIEILKMVFPNAGEVHLSTILDQAQTEFAVQSRILEGLAQFSDLTSYIAWELPSNFIEAIRVLMYDSNGYPIYDQDLTVSLKWKIKKDLAGKGSYIHFYASDGTNLTQIPSAIKSMYLHYARKPASIKSIDGTYSQEFEISEEYHEGILSLAKAKLLGVFPQVYVTKNGETVNAIDRVGIREEMANYKQYLNEAKRAKNTKGRRGYNVILYQDAGKYELPKETEISGLANENLNGI